MSGRERLAKCAYGQMCRRPGELELFVAIEHSSHAHELKPDNGIMVVVFDGVPLWRLERLCGRAVWRAYVYR